MVDERADLHVVGELLDAPHMVAVIMRDDDVVQFLDVGVFAGFRNALRIASVEAAPSSIDKHGLAGGADDEGRLAAFDIDKINFQGLCGLRAGRHREHRQGQSEQEF